MAQAPPLRLIDEREAARRLGVSVGWLRRSRSDRPEAIESGTLPAPWYERHRVYYLEDEIESCLILRGSRGLRKRS